MDGQKERILILLAKFETGEASEQELGELDKWYQSFDNDVKYTTGLSLAQQMQAKDNLLIKINSRLDQEVAAEESHHQVRSINLWPRVAIAAIVLICLSVGGYLLIQKKVATQQIAQSQQYDIVPGGNKAFLTLANGKKISLTDAKNGELSVQSGVRVVKEKDGQLVYTAADTGSFSSSLSYNTIETPKGGQYQVLLPDGSKVWLNAASSLKYPASFGALKERRVQLSGEAYFEVAHNKVQPFRVQTDKQTITVLGTHFDVNAYTDEPYTKTTLLEGSVNINNTIFLKPGEQSTLNRIGNDFTVSPAETDDAVAWKNGKFVFQNEHIESIMRKLARWYDVDVVYQDSFNDKTFTGSISRFDNISKILNKITFTSAVNFRIEGRRITVIK
jgi:ferric-dicitrate binding protein FerR (iron transport regulator)